jgi:uncharacterized membrane protein YgcG
MRSNRVLIVSCNDLGTLRRAIYVAALRCRLDWGVGWIHRGAGRRYGGFPISVSVYSRRSVESLFRATAMAKRLYVGNLKYTATSEHLHELFEQFGTVTSAQVLSDRETGRSRGFGFVEMANDDEALAAIESLDGQDHDGRRLTVNEARPRTSGGGSAGGSGGGGGFRAGGGGYRGGGYAGGDY